jgi:hypothetical protein
MMSGYSGQRIYAISLRWEVPVDFLPLPGESIISIESGPPYWVRIWIDGTQDTFEHRQENPPANLY